MIDLVKYFNDNTRDKLWKKNGEDYERWFGRQIRTLKNDVESGSNDKELSQFTYRLALGYYGIGRQGGLTSGLVTEDAMVNGVKKTADHLLGTTQIGKYIHEECEKYNWDFDYMVNEWLYENLWLWMTIKVTTQEHKSDNIIRNEHTIEDKLLLKHYKKVSTLVG
jgi:hypothetical protein